MELLNYYTGWASIILGFVAGAVIGLFFYKDDWAGGYNSWQRRMMRLGHISFFGLGFINLVFALSINNFQIHLTTDLPFYLLAAGNILMPTVCFLSAYRKNFRQLFPLPVACMLIGTLIFILNGGLL